MQDNRRLGLVLAATSAETESTFDLIFQVRLKQVPEAIQFACLLSWNIPNLAAEMREVT